MVVVVVVETKIMVVMVAGVVFVFVFHLGKGCPGGVLWWCCVVVWLV